MTKYPKVRPKAMTAMSRAPYFDALGVKVDAALVDTVDGVLDVVLEPEPVAVEPADVAVVLPADPEPVAVDIVVAAVEFALLAPVADEVTVALPLDEDPVEVWAKTPPDEEDLILDVTEDATPEETALPLQEPEILMLW